MNRRLKCRTKSVKLLEENKYKISKLYIRQQFHKYNAKSTGNERRNRQFGYYQN